MREPERTLRRDSAVLLGYIVGAGVFFALTYVWGAHHEIVRALIATAVWTVLFGVVNERAVRRRRQPRT